MGRTKLLIYGFQEMFYKFLKNWTLQNLNNI